MERSAAVAATALPPADRAGSGWLAAARLARSDVGARAAALAALARIGLNAIVESGRLVAVVGALSAFWPRPYGAIDLGSFRAGYLTAEPDFARLRLVDARIGMAENLSRALLRKLVRLQAAMGALAAAAILMGMGVAIDWPR